jgi:hypothetical protein
MANSEALRFPNTRWSLVLRARDADPAAIQALLEAFAPPTRAYLLAAGTSASRPASMHNPHREHGNSGPPKL